MKFLILFVWLTYSVFSAEIDAYAKEMKFSRDYKSALQQAKKVNKPLMLVIVADYCPWCRKLERQTLASVQIKSRLKEVVPLIMDQTYDAQRFPKMYLTPRKPTIFFINPHTEEHFLESPGYVKKEEFSAVLDQMQKEYRK